MQSGIPEQLRLVLLFTFCYFIGMHLFSRLFFPIHSLNKKAKCLTHNELVLVVDMVITSTRLIVSGYSSSA